LRQTGYRLAAVERAVSAARHVIVDMAGFPPPASPPRSCVRICGGAGHPAPRCETGPEVSYTELDFDTATAAGLDRLVFLLDENAIGVGIPLSALIDLEFGAW